MNNMHKTTDYFFK